jgi:hypothetical protein
MNKKFQKIVVIVVAVGMVLTTLASFLAFL